MANEESNKFSSNLKVPPLKIVLNSHQNNTVVNLGNIDEKQSSLKKDTNSNEHAENGEYSRRNGSGNSDSGGDRHQRKGVKADRRENKSSQISARTAGFSSSSSSSSSSSDRSTSTTPSSESESLASNSTIISDQQQVKNKADTKDDTTVGKLEKKIKHDSKIPITEKSTSSTTNPHNKRSHDNIGEQSSESSATSLKDHTLNANQRITRSSQRAAQQNKSENPSDGVGEESNLPENQEKIVHESARKAKRRKGDAQEIEHDDAQSISQLTVKMANIHPADYQLPTHNSIELFRDIRKRPYKKLSKLSHIQPKVPHGFKDYLINNGPYLLDGNKLGGGLNGPKPDDIINGYYSKIKNHTTSRVPLRMKMSNLLYGKSHSQSSQQRHSSYIIPKPLEVPAALPAGSPLNELFLDQERARQQMRIQHLKERERAILATEQEILRAYNKAAIADIKQKLHLSACTYFYYQEKYHYLNEKTGTNGKMGAKEVPHSQDNSFLCIEGGETTKTNDNNVSSKEHNNSATENCEEKTKVVESEMDVDKTTSILGNDSTLDVNVNDSTIESTATAENTTNSTTTTTTTASTTTTITTTITTTTATTTNTNTNTTTATITDDNDGGSSEISSEENKSNCVDKEVNKKDETSDDEKKSQHVAEKSRLQQPNGEGDDDVAATSKPFEAPEESEQKDKQANESGKNDERVKNLDPDSDNSLSELPTKKADITEKVSDDDLKAINKGIFVAQLQDIDDKWDKIKKDMLVRHKNEADSLYAVQTLEWEWKAKEIGVCDVRVSLKIEPEFVPRVEVLALDY